MTQAQTSDLGSALAAVSMAEEEEEEPSRPFLVMGDIVHDFRLVDFAEDWKKVKCKRREAYGCGDNGELIVRGLDLYVRAGPDDDPDLHPGLCIRAHPDVLSRIGMEIEESMAEIFGRRIRLSARVYTVAGDVIVLRISFLARHEPTDFLSYYLVYDSSAAALFLLPRRPINCRPICTTFPLKVGEDKYSLVLMAEKVVASSFVCTEGVLLMWSPPPEPPSPGSRWKSKLDSTTAWTIKGRARENADGFRASVVFLWKGNAVWADLGQGILYCDCSDLNDGPGLVDVKCNKLPTECWDTDYLDQVPKHVYRNMGCVGDSIWFVIIESSYTCPGETKVKVWTLNLLSEEEKWIPHREFNMQAIWELDAFNKQALPQTVPKYPMFRQQDDGVLYMLLPEPSTGDKAYAHLVGIDLSSSHGMMHLVVNRRLAMPWMDRPVFLDPDFFTRSA